MLEKIIGILGGMGPYATVDLFKKILDFTPANKDADYLHIIIDNNPKVPNRRKALTEGGPDPTPELQRMAKKMEIAGADFLLIGCNSAHAFIQRVQEAVDIPIISIIEETARETKLHNPNITKVGLLAGTGTIKLKLYDKAFADKGIEVIQHENGLQERVLHVIDSVKAKVSVEDIKPEIISVCHELIKLGAQAIIGGCTEIPIVLKDGDLTVPVVDANEYYAKAAVNYALGRIPLPSKKIIIENSLFYYPKGRVNY